MLQRRLGLAAFAALALLGAAPAFGQDAAEQAAPRAVDIASHVAEASQRFGIPEHWIYAVMRTESAGRIGAVSSKGAQGLMQLMPATWARQRARFGLGTDPFEPRDNIMAGASYLREMYDSYGASGFLAAYNAGPGRYEQWRIAVVRSPPKPAPMSPKLHRCCKQAARQQSLPAHRPCSRFTHPGHRASFSRCAGAHPPTHPAASPPPRRRPPFPLHLRP